MFNLSSTLKPNNLKKGLYKKPSKADLTEEYTHGQVFSQFLFTLHYCRISTVFSFIIAAPRHFLGLLTIYLSPEPAVNYQDLQGQIGSD